MFFDSFICTYLVSFYTEFFATPAPVSTNSLLLSCTARRLIERLTERRGEATVFTAATPWTRRYLSSLWPFPHVWKWKTAPPSRWLWGHTHTTAGAWYCEPWPCPGAHLVADPPPPALDHSQRIFRTWHQASLPWRSFPASRLHSLRDGTCHTLFYLSARLSLPRAKAQKSPILTYAWQF